MDNLQNFLTLAATVIEYFFFAYLAVVFMVYSLESPTTTKQPRPTTVSPPTWKRSVAPGASLAGMAG